MRKFLLSTLVALPVFVLSSKAIARPINPCGIDGAVAARIQNVGIVCRSLSGPIYSIQTQLSDGSRARISIIATKMEHVQVWRYDSNNRSVMQTSAFFYEGKMFTLTMTEDEIDQVSKEFAFFAPQIAALQSIARSPRVVF